MSFIWSYFKLSGRVAFCTINNCKYQKDFPPQSSTSNLASHLQHNHPEQYKEFKEKCEAKTKNQIQQPSIKRAFASSAPASSSATCDLDEEISQITAKRSKPIELALRAKSPWEKDGEKTEAINKVIMEFIACDIQPLSVVENVGFKRLIEALQPRYHIPSRKYLTNNLMPNMVRWSSTYQMMDRFLLNRQAVNLLCAQDQRLPKFSSDDWTTISILRQILTPINSATFLLQNRNTPISVIIPLFRVITHTLKKETNELMNIKLAISEGLKKRMAGKVDAQGNVKRIQWDENRNLILATILDPRFKIGNYFDAARHCEYKRWLINEAERTAMTDLISEQFEVDVVAPTQNESVDLFAEFEEDVASTMVETCSSPVTDPSVLSTRQKAEVEANDYLRGPKLPKNTDPYQFWTGENAIKCERLFSTAGLIVDDLRKSLSKENVEKLLFLHHNLKIYNFDYE